MKYFYKNFAFLALVFSLLAILYFSIESAIWGNQSFPFGFELNPFHIFYHYLYEYPASFVAQNDISLEGTKWFEDFCSIAIKQILGNVVLFIPAGFFFSLCFKNFSWKNAWIFGFLFAFGKEFLQIFLGTVLFLLFDGNTRYMVFDTGDILLNLIGFFLGCAAGMLCVKILQIPKIGQFLDA